MFVIPTSLSGRELKSEDGSKTLEAEFVRYVASSDMVTLSKGVGRNIVMPAASFSQEDRNLFVEEQREIDKKHAIKIKIAPNNDRSKESHGEMVVSYRTSQYTFEVANSSESYFDGLELRYWIVLELHNQKTGEGEISIKTESKQLLPLGGGSSEIVEAPSVKLTLGAKSVSTCKCPSARASVAAEAGSIERDRILGTKVEVVDAKGEVIYTEVSSNRVKSILSDEKNS